MAILDIRKRLYDVDPYLGFTPMPEYVHGWGSDDENFQRVIDQVQPKQIIEVGVWLGASTIHMAKCSPQSQFLCIDTWLGSRDFRSNLTDPTRYKQLLLKHGYPEVYYQFLSNMVHHGLQARVTPFAQTSLIAARNLKDFQYTADLIYVDASHDYDDVLADLEAYFPLLNAGGILFGDDTFTFIDVQHAVVDFSKANLLDYELLERQWVIKA